MSKGIYVGRFNEERCRNGESKKAVDKVMADSGLKYTNYKEVKKGKKVVALDIWVCSFEECEDFQ